MEKRKKKQSNQEEFDRHEIKGKYKQRSRT
jgi:hypothetical protein